LGIAYPFRKRALVPRVPWTREDGSVDTILNKWRRGCSEPNGVRSKALRQKV